MSTPHIVARLDESHSTHTDNILRRTCYYSNRWCLCDYQMCQGFVLKLSLQYEIFPWYIQIKSYFRVSWSINASLHTSKHKPRNDCVGLMKWTVALQLILELLWMQGLAPGSGQSQVQLQAGQRTDSEQPWGEGLGGVGWWEAQRELAVRTCSSETQP